MGLVIPPSLSSVRARTNVFYYCCTSVIETESLSELTVFLCLPPFSFYIWIILRVVR